MRALLSRGKIAIVAVAVLTAATSAYAAPTVTVLTDKDGYRAGETIALSLGGENHDEPLSVDVYVGLIGRDGALYTLGEAGWGAYLEPWMADVLVPNPFYMAPVVFQWFDTPCVMPPIGDEGEYSFAAGLTQPGTLDFVAEISFAPFTINPPESHIYVSAELGNDANDGSQDSPFKTITHALASVSGSEARPVTIHLAAGTYSEGTNRERFPLNMKSWVSLSGADAATTILDAEGEADHVICCEDVEKLTIEGFTITHGQASSRTGGGVLCTRSSPTIRGNVISGNRGRYGAGIYCGDDSSPAIENNTISDNAAGRYDFDGGGGMYCDSTSAANIKNNLFVGNSATLGGGIYYFDDSPAKIENNTITGNSAKYGAGIYCVEASRSFVGGPADSASEAVRTGTVGFPERTFDVSDCIIWGNRAPSRYTYDDDGLYRDLYCCSAVYSCIEEEEQGEGNIHDDPMFVSGMFGPYYLDAQSPCVDAGSRSAVQAGLSLWTTQADGLPDLGVVDMGYHRPAAVSERPPTAHIDLISPNPMTQGEGTLEFRGHGEGGDLIVGYRWLSHLDGYLSSEQHFEIPHAAHLTIGTHEISFYVRDSKGGWSEPDIAQLTILPNPRGEVFVDAEAGDDLNGGSELDPFGTITHALGCVHGTPEKPVIVHAGSGIYAASTDGESFPLNMKSWVSVIGEGADTTTLDAESGSYHVITCFGVDNLSIAGLRIQGGNADGRTPDDRSGGGVFCDRSSLVIFGSTLAGNYADDGGAICCQNESNLLIEGNTIEGNSAEVHGGGVYSDDSECLIEASAINDNWARSAGGGIYCYGSPLALSNSLVSGNTSGVDDSSDARNDGGGIYCYGSRSMVSNSVISDNTSEYWGGGVYCYSSPFMISNSVISDNTSGVAGGGMYIAHGSLTALNNIISRNSTFLDGGGIYYDSTTSATITHNTIADNTARSNGGGIYCYWGTPVTVSDCILWGNGDDPINCPATYCCIEIELSGEGNICDDPKFVSGPLGDYYLSARSPCIDAGSRSAEEAGFSLWSTQTDGMPDLGIADMGYHRPAAVSDRAPTAHIDFISPNPVTQGEETVQFSGHGEGKGDMIGYRWLSDLDDNLSFEQSFDIPHAAHLSLGKHEISFLVRDSEGGWSVPEIAELVVLPNARDEMFVDAEVGDDVNYGSELDPLRTITQALGCAHGTEDKPVVIHVAAGTYAASTNGETFPLQMKSWVSIIGQGTDMTILDAGYDSFHVITCLSVDNLWIAGFRIQCGNAAGRNNNYGRGAGILCDNSSPTILGNTIVGNCADEGGGLCCRDGSNPIIEDNEIRGNEAESNGGGISCMEVSKPTIQGNRIAGNTAAEGGGIYCSGSSPTIKNNSILGNTAAHFSGGGMSCSYESSPVIQNNMISDNTCSSSGGGIDCCMNSSPMIFNNTILDNAAGWDSGGISSDWESSPTIIDCIIWGNGDDLYDCSATYCCIEDPDGGEGDIHDDPMFMTGPFGDFYLRPGSPCIDAGSRSAAAAGLADRTTQADGTPDTGTVDMGYHYPILETPIDTGKDR